MADALFRNDRPLSSGDVARILAARFPVLASRTVRYLGAGWDFTAWEVGGEWVFRFPKREKEQARVRLERRILPDLAPRLPLPVPVPVFDGVGGRDFPWCFSGYRKLVGVPAGSVPVPEGARAGLAAGLGAFLRALHAFPVDRVRDAGGSADDPALAYEEARQEAAVAFEVFGSDAHAAAARAFVEGPARRIPPWPHPPVTIHDDLLPEHVLTDPTATAVTGVLDWGDMGVGDPASDFAGLAYWLGPGILPDLLRRYGRTVDDAFLDRVLARMLFVAAEQAAWADPRVRSVERARALAVVGEVLAARRGDAPWGSEA